MKKGKKNALEKSFVCQRGIIDVFHTFYEKIYIQQNYPCSFQFSKKLNH